MFQLAKLTHVSMCAAAGSCLRRSSVHQPALPAAARLAGHTAQEQGWTLLASTATCEWLDGYAVLMIVFEAMLLHHALLG
jgi:hypothetical protein